MSGRIQDRVAVVTGGCSGIGLATVRRFVEEGAKVVIGDIDDARGAELVGELGGAGAATYAHVDVTSKDEVDALFADWLPHVPVVVHGEELPPYEAPLAVPGEHNRRNAACALAVETDQVGWA